MQQTSLSAISRSDGLEDLDARECPNSAACGYCGFCLCNAPRDAKAEAAEDLDAPLASALGFCGCRKPEVQGDRVEDPDAHAGSTAMWRHMNPEVSDDLNSHGAVALCCCSRAQYDTAAEAIEDLDTRVGIAVDSVCKCAVCRSAQPVVAPEARLEAVEDLDARGGSDFCCSPCNNAGPLEVGLEDLDARVDSAFCMCGCRKPEAQTERLEDLDARSGSAVCICCGGYGVPS